MAEGNSSNEQDVKRETLTTRQGHPVTDNQNIRTVGNRGPATLENYHFIEKISHFDREEIPERVVHARGTGAFGYFETYGKVGDEPVEKYTRAKVFSGAGKRTPLMVRFSTVAGAKDSPETARDPRGFAVKMYTEDGNWDLVGNNLKIFFIRDAMKFPDMIHAFKADPASNVPNPQRMFDFVSRTPEATHMITFLFSPWGIPATYRHMQGSGVNTYKWVNDKGDAVLVKYHWEPKQGIRNLTQEEAASIQAKNVGHATQDLYEAIERGEYPEWELFVQIMEDDYHSELDFDPLDDTKLWPEDKFPWLPVGRMVLNRNPVDFHAEIEQAAFGTGVLVDGMDFSDDKMLQGRTFSYSDTQRYRIGANYLKLPVNAPKVPVRTNQHRGQMDIRDPKESGENPHINYEPSMVGGYQEASKEDRIPHQPMYHAAVMSAPIDRPNNYGQAGHTYRSFEDWERNELIKNLSEALAVCDQRIQEAMIHHFTQADEDYGRRVKEGIAKITEEMKREHQVPGREAGQSKFGQGPRAATKAAEEAVKQSHKADPY
ncbi:catalase [Paenibacillus sp. alder61]|uniref:Catalase n=1 Tax=Paenibacillus faecis TaxID=862114 RepID=A0A5D0CKP7_9BACL|nr:MULTISPECIES: catalase [Paenibacillus]MCA1295225.1 catalase [Paenibacillus sp. alder61]TYA10110.1 catalase [Paenibacillus faecis]